VAETFVDSWPSVARLAPVICEYAPRGSESRVVDYAITSAPPAIGSFPTASGCKEFKEGGRPAMIAMTPELRTEIETILGIAENHTRHALAFRGLNDGLCTKDLANRWTRSESYASMVVRSLRLMLDGEIPERPSIALTNSFGYRELLDHRNSPALREYVFACLRVLRTRNPRVRLEPMGIEVYAERAMTPGLRRPASYCPMCFLMRPCDCE
jgi:hypothetical protein